GRGEGPRALPAQAAVGRGDRRAGRHRPRGGWLHREVADGTRDEGRSGRRRGPGRGRPGRGGGPQAARPVRDRQRGVGNAPTPHYGRPPKRPTLAVASATTSAAVTGTW